MTYEKKASEVADPGAAHPAPGVRSSPRLAAWGPAAIFAVVAAFLAGDIATDVADGASSLHLATEGVVMTFALAGAVIMWRQLRTAKLRARDLQRDLDGTRADLARWRSEAQDALRGLGAAIDAQFGRWGLTPAERDVALLLLKGFSLKEIAELRATGERTARQQSLAVYRKAGLAGRAELAAFFLEDLLLPADRPDRVPAARRG
ncbi:MAG TPA: helix-turn-helix transcriptional regulator [Anaeromyxobacteraceae bacterium]|nr:helix-turn-helix transcriptional regulator [Anaeromyxobacteraceae bacterium]